MKKLILTFLVIVPLLVLGGSFAAGTFLTWPANAPVGNCPSDLACENVQFQSESGSTIKGWFVKGGEGKGAVVIMHGARSNRSVMIDRMEFLRKAGYSVLAFDFQGCGESEGKILSFGYIESRDAAAAMKFIKQKLPSEKIGAIGISMGGAAYLLAKDRPDADAVILEMVYPSMQQAIDNRLNMWLFKGADNISPLLTWQFPMRIGASMDDIRPIDKVSSIKSPVFIIAAENDHHTTIEESRQLFDTANEPKEMFVVPGVEHGDMLQAAPQQYPARVTSFFDKTLRK